MKLSIPSVSIYLVKCNPKPGVHYCTGVNSKNKFVALSVNIPFTPVKFHSELAVSL